MRIVLILGFLTMTMAAISFAPAPAFAQDTGQKCISLKKKVNGREVLINTCKACQVVKVERIRGGGALPTFRTFIVQGKSTVNVPFKGPGRTRMVGAKGCSG